jgi:uncharacterized protein YigE (DUF2233 family)
LGALALAACSEQPAGEPVVRAPLDGAVAPDTPVPTPTKAAETGVCQPARFEGVSLTHCIADPARHAISTALAPASGERAGTIAGWAEGRQTDSIVFVVNGGMYGDDLRPVGYFVEGSERLAEIDRSEASGNFYMKPNGVFFGSSGEWRVLETETFVRTIGTRPEFGTQSGPMLVVEGEMHPRFQENGPSRAVRNGVGVDAQGRAHFVISDEALSFGQLARFYRDELEVPNALYLDGNVSSLWNPASGRQDGGRVGPLIVVETK